MYIPRGHPTAGGASGSSRRSSGAPLLCASKLRVLLQELTAMRAKDASSKVGLNVYKHVFWIL